MTPLRRGATAGARHSGAMIGVGVSCHVKYESGFMFPVLIKPAGLAEGCVVAVFDRRLATRSYRATLLATMPPLRRTVDREAVLATLTALRPLV